MGSSVYLGGGGGYVASGRLAWGALVAGLGAVGVLSGALTSPLQASCTAGGAGLDGSVGLDWSGAASKMQSISPGGKALSSLAASAGVCSLMKLSMTKSLWAALAARLALEARVTLRPT